MDTKFCIRVHFKFKHWKLLACLIEKNLLYCWNTSLFLELDQWKKPSKGTLTPQITKWIISKSRCYFLDKQEMEEIVEILDIRKQPLFSQQWKSFCFSQVKEIIELNNIFFKKIMKTEMMNFFERWQCVNWSEMHDLQLKQKFLFHKI